MKHMLSTIFLLLTSTTTLIVGQSSPYYRIRSQGIHATYFTLGWDEHATSSSINQQDIIGKVVGTIDGNAWNILSLKIWDMTINNLNTAALLTSD